MTDENLTRRNMETKKIHTFFLFVMSLMLSLIAWGGNNIYQDQKALNKTWSEKMSDDDKRNIITEYRFRVLEEIHDIKSPPLGY